MFQIRKREKPQCNLEQAKIAKELLKLLEVHQLQNTPVRNTTLTIHASSGLLYAFLIGLNIYKLFNPDFRNAQKYGHFEKLELSHFDCISEQRPAYFHGFGEDPVIDWSCRDCCVQTSPGPEQFILLAACLFLSVHYFLKELDNKFVNYDVVIEGNETEILGLLDKLLSYKYSDQDRTTLFNFRFKINEGTLIGRKLFVAALDILNPIVASAGLPCEPEELVLDRPRNYY